MPSGRVCGFKLCGTNIDDYPLQFLYCSKKCRSAVHYERRHGVPSREVRKCLCGELIAKDRRRNVRYCSRSCQRVAALRRAGKQCKDCAQDMPPSARQYCPPCAETRRWNRSLQARYGINPDFYDWLLESQGYVCAGCRCSTPGRLHVDHDHSTGHVRGLLCGNCNRALGLLGDDVTTLNRLVDYLFVSKAHCALPGGGTVSGHLSFN